MISITCYYRHREKDKMESGRGEFSEPLLEYKLPF